MNTTYFLNCAAGNIFGTQATPAIPANYYLGLSTTTPTAAGGNVTEPSSSAGYERVRLTSLGTPSGGVVTNTSDVDFDESTGSWGTITHFVIYDAATGGNLLMYGALATARTVEAETVMTVRSGQLTLSMQNPA